MKTLTTEEFLEHISASNTLSCEIYVWDVSVGEHVICGKKADDRVFIRFHCCEKSSVKFVCKDCLENIKSHYFDCRRCRTGAANYTWKFI